MRSGGQRGPRRGKDSGGSRLTTDLDGSFEFEEDGLVDEDFSRLGAQELDLVLLQLDLFPWAVATHCVVWIRGQRRSSSQLTRSLSPDSPTVDSLHPLPITLPGLPRTNWSTRTGPSDPHRRISSPRDPGASPARRCPLTSTRPLTYPTQDALTLPLTRTDTEHQKTSDEPSKSLSMTESRSMSCPSAMVAKGQGCRRGGSSGESWTGRERGGRVGYGARVFRYGRFLDGLGTGRRGQRGPSYA